LQVDFLDGRLRKPIVSSNPRILTKVSVFLLTTNLPTQIAVNIQLLVWFFPELAPGFKHTLLLCLPYYSKTCSNELVGLIFAS